MPPTPNAPLPRDAWLAHQRAGQALRQLQQLVGAEPFVVVKSYALAARYGWDPAGLPAADLDVRMPFASYRRLRAQLRGSPVVLVDNPAYANLVLGIDGQLVDVEATLGPPFLTRLRVDDVLLRATLAEQPGTLPFLVPDTLDHVLLLAINLFKDGPTASATAHANAVRLVEESAIDTDVLRARAKEGSMHASLAAVAEVLAPSSSGWGRIAEALRPVPRHLPMRSHDVWSRLRRRAGSDRPLDRLLALGVTAAGQLTRRLLDPAAAAAPGRHAPKAPDDATRRAR